MNGWEVKKLSEVCQVDKSQGIHKNLPYVGMENIESNTARFIGSTEPQSVKSASFSFTTKHLLYGRLRPYLNKVIAPEFEGHCSTELFPIKPSKCLDRNFLLYWFLMDSTVRLINATCTGARMPRANMNTVLEFEFLLPPLSEQKRIVAIVDEAFEGIDRAIANTQKNLTNARELFESYLNAIFTQKGDGWVEKQLGDIAELIDSLHKTPSYIDEGGFPMVRVTDIKDGALNLKNARRVDEATFIEFSKRHSPKIGDIVFSRVGSYGVPALVQSDELFCLGQNTVFIIPRINSQLLYFFLRSPNSQEQIEKFVAGTTQGTISLKSIKQIRVPIPPDSAQPGLAATLTSVLIEAHRLEAIYKQKLAAFNELKQSILQKAFTGELTADTTNQATKTAKEVIAA